MRSTHEQIFSRSVLLLAVLASSISALPAGPVSARDEFDALKFVDPLIGTVNGGHVFPGATLPFGMAKAVADVEGENQGGFASDNSKITGFSHMHDSGTGGAASLGIMPLFAQMCADVNTCAYAQQTRPVLRVDGSVKATPGYFGISLQNSIKAEMTVSSHVALYKFTFGGKSSQNEAAGNPHILLDLVDLPQSRQSGSASVDPKTGRITATGTFQPSFGQGSYKVYTCTDFKGATIKSVGNFKKNTPAANQTTIAVKGEQDGNKRLSAGVWVQFNDADKNEIMARVGISFISQEKACSNAEKEVKDYSFESLQKTAESAWRKKLSVYEVDATGVSESLQRVFWSGLYRIYISPQDYTGENPLWNSTEPYFDSFYCIWDSFRAGHPLLTLTDPEAQTLMVRSLIDIYRHEGRLPDCRMSFCPGWTQGGSNADTLLADSYVKGITKDVDWETAYKAVVTDAEVNPPNYDLGGRGGIKSWKTLGYIPKNDPNDMHWSKTRSVSRSVEYAYNDFSIALIAKGLGKDADYKKYMKSSGNWKNLVNPNQRSMVNGADSGFVGFMQPRMADGTWAQQDPIFCSPLQGFHSCYLGMQSETYEGPLWMYSTYVPQDMAGLIKTLGGPANFTARLEYLQTSGILYIGNEQSFLPVFQFHYTGRPGLSSKFVRSYIPSQFNDTVVGIPGNDDSGAMGSFTTLSMMGIWPIPGQDVYLLTAPYFKHFKLTNGQTGKVAAVTANNFDGDNNIYIQSAKLNGKDYKKNWITHDFFLNGGTLELELGPKESTTWGTGNSDIPPSYPPN